MFFLFWVKGPNFFFLWSGAWAPLAPLVGSSSTCPRQLILSECLDPTYSWLRFLLARFLFSSLFFSRSCWLFSREHCTIHETYKLHFSVTFSLKMGPMVLFTHLKIILLQCFQFLVSVKISCIQMDPKSMTVLLYCVII